MLGPTIVCELGLNHLGDASRARRMLDRLVEAATTHASVQVVGDPDRLTRDRSSADLLRAHALSIAECCALIEYGVSRGLVMGAAVLDVDDIAELRAVGAGFFKILSGDLTYEPLIRAAAGSGAWVLLATGGASDAEIAAGVATAREAASGVKIAVVHTVLGSPTPTDRLNLRRIPVLAGRLGIAVGYGEHGDDSNSLLTATALGADPLLVYVAEERDPSLPDGPHALPLDELPRTMRAVRAVASSLGRGEEPEPSPVARRSVVAARPIVAGTTIGADDIAYKRPGTGLAPAAAARLVGTAAARDFLPDEDLH